MKAGVLLVGHGSEKSSDSSSPIRGLARDLRAAEAAAEIRVAFWKEEPYLHYALDLFESRDVFVVPVFTSEGYFTQRLLPRELGLSPLRDRPWVRAHRCAPVGTHPAMAELVFERAEEAAPLSADAKRSAALIVLGHGTEAHPASGETTYALVEGLRRRKIYREVVPAFLDQSPTLAEVLMGLDEPDVIVVPFFIADGWHVGTTIPAELARGGSQRAGATTTVWYGKAVGTHPGMRNVVESVLSEAMGRVESMEAPVAPRASQTPAPESRESFFQWLTEGGTGWKILLQVGIAGSDETGFELRHREDLEKPPSELTTHRSPASAEPLGGRSKGGEHRSLRTAPDLAPGWRLTELNADGVWEAVGHLYPAVAVHRELARRGDLPVFDFQESVSRQTGIYAALDGLTSDEVRAVAQVRCHERCLRIPLWEPVRRDVGAQSAVEAPCPEACPAFLLELRKGYQAGPSQP